jgi:hypothetical protein
VNEVQRPNVRVVREALGTGYNRIRGIERAWRNGRVSSSPTRIALRPIHIKQITVPVTLGLTSEVVLRQPQPQRDAPHQISAEVIALVHVTLQCGCVPLHLHHASGSECRSITIPMLRHLAVPYGPSAASQMILSSSTAFDMSCLREMGVWRGS